MQLSCFRKFDTQKLHPLERGFSGKKVTGQKLGPPPPVGDVTFDNFESICLDVRFFSNIFYNTCRCHSFFWIYYMLPVALRYYCRLVFSMILLILILFYRLSHSEL